MLFLWIISIIIVTHQLSLKFDQSRKLLLQVAFALTTEEDQEG